MKKITLFLGLLICTTLSFSQINPCVTIESHGFITISNDGNNNCTLKAYVNAIGDFSAPKGLRIQVYIGTTAGTPIADNCYTVPANSPSTNYVTSAFTVPCNASLTYVISRSTSSNGACNGGDCGPAITLDAGPLLPIKMTGFYAKRKNSAVGLAWQTESEIHAKEFIVQRKVGKEFIDVATIAASNASTGGSYFYNDLNSYQGISQYRLKLIDQDGTFKFSEIRTVKGTASANDFTIFPNPSAGNARVTISDISAPTDVQLIDNSGRILKIVSMNNSNTADFNSIQNGMYMIRIINKNSGETLTKKLSVIN